MNETRKEYNKDRIHILKLLFIAVIAASVILFLTARVFILADWIVQYFKGNHVTIEDYKI